VKTTGCQTHSTRERNKSKRRGVNKERPYHIITERLTSTFLEVRFAFGLQRKQPLIS